MVSRTCVLVKPIDVFFKLISFQLIVCYSESSSLSADFSTCVDLGATLVVEHGLLVAVVSLLSTRDCRRRGLCRCCWPAVEHLLSSCATWALGPRVNRIGPGIQSMSPTLARRFLSTRPLGKSPTVFSTAWGCYQAEVLKAFVFLLSQPWHWFLWNKLSLPFIRLCSWVPSLCPATSRRLYINYSVSSAPSVWGMTEPTAVSVVLKTVQNNNSSEDGKLFCFSPLLCAL